MANSATVGQLNVNLSLESATFEKGLDKAKGKLAQAQKSFESVGAKLAGLGTRMSFAITAPIVAGAAAAIQGAKAQAAAMAQVDAAIKSMGNQAGLSSDQLSKFADKLEVKSLYDADEILKKSTANLLTFGNVAGENFLKAQQAAVDLASRMEGDLQGATLMIGKALNNPIKGLTALSRAGIQFTDQQKEQIKTMQESGNIAGAQSIMLAELNRQFGGAAEAAAKAEPMREVMVKLGQAGDVIGEKLLPILPVITDAIVKVLDAFTALSPATQKWVIIGGGLAAALGPVVLGIGALATGISAAIPLIATVVAGLAAVSAPLLGMVAVLGTAYLAWKNWDKITGFVKGVYDGVKTYLVDKMTGALNYVKEKITAVGDWFFKLYDRVVGHSYVPDLVDGIEFQFGRLQKAMVDPTVKATETAGEAFRTLASDTQTLMDRLFPVQAQLRQIQDDRAKLDKAYGSGLISGNEYQAATAKLGTETQDVINQDRIQVPDKTGDAMDAADRSAQPLRDVLQKQEDFRDMFRSTFSDGVHAALDGDLKGYFKHFLADTLEKSFQTGLNAIADGLSGLFGGASGGTAGQGLGGLIAGAVGLIGGLFAGGGRPPVGKVSIVGEKGPEAFVPDTPGTIIPNHQLDMSPIGTAATPYSAAGVGSAAPKTQAPVVKLVVEASPYFDARVDQRAHNVAMPLAVQAAQAGSHAAVKKIQDIRRRSIA